MCLQCGPHLAFVALTVVTMHVFTLRGRPFDSWGGRGGYGFFVKKKFVQQILENK